MSGLEAVRLGARRKRERLRSKPPGRYPVVHGATRRSAPSLGRSPERADGRWLGALCRDWRCYGARLRLNAVAVTLAKGSRLEDAALLLAEAQLLAKDSIDVSTADHVPSCVTVALAKIGKPEEALRITGEIA